MMLTLPAVNTTRSSFERTMGRERVVRHKGKVARNAQVGFWESSDGYRFFHGSSGSLSVSPPFDHDKLDLAGKVQL